MEDFLSTLAGGLVDESATELAKRAGCGRVLEKAGKGCAVTLFVSWFVVLGLLGLWYGAKALWHWIQ